mmetsp:Transcript_12177/g.15960  ORF Transcript_12177/g.15960 Transcript_12177/m.15960 type:complete len:304 (+) Transcript_12177:55-966(+)
MPTRSVQPKQLRQKARVKRALKKKEPKLIENTKQSLILRGKKTSEVINTTLKDIYKLKQPHAKMFQRHNDVQPFEDETKIEFLCQKNDCSLFALGSHNKKRPHNLVLGRLFDGHLLDMVELGIQDFVPVEMFQGSMSKRVGAKPCLVFQGEQWDQAEGGYSTLKNILLDFFRGDEVSTICLKGLDHVMVCTISEGKIFIRHYAILLKRSGTKVPNINLEPMGPSWDFILRRHKVPSSDLWKLACRKPKQLKEKKRKNITRNEFGDKIGRIHLGKQDLTSMKVRKVKALRQAVKSNQDKEEENA